MRVFRNPRCRARLLAALLGLGCCAPAPAQSLPFAKRWLLEGQPAVPGAYTVATIDDTGITWSVRGKGPPPCTQRFALVKERPGTVYRDGRGKQFVAGVPGSIPTYLLNIVGGNCRGIEDQVRISYPLIYDVTHIEVIEYVKGRQAGSRRFYRKAGTVKAGEPPRPGSTGGHPGPRTPGRP